MTIEKRCPVSYQLPEIPSPVVAQKGNIISGFSFSGKHSILNDTQAVFKPDSILNKNRKFDITEKDLEIITKDYLSWLNEPLYLVFQNSEGKTEFHKAMKRGNAVYSYKLEKRIEKSTKDLKRKGFSRLILRNISRKYFTNVLFLTLTFNPKAQLNNRHKSWKSIQHYFDLYTISLRQRFGKIWILKSVQSTKNGYPHIHALLICEKPFECFYHNGQYRVKEKRKFEKNWFSFVDVVVPINFQAVKTYITRDLCKNFLRKVKTPQDYLSLSLMWLYEMRSVSISGDKILHDLISAFSLIQITLTDQINEIKQKHNSKFLGLTLVYLIGGKPPPNSFTLELDDEKYSELISNLIKPQVVIDYEQV